MGTTEGDILIDFGRKRWRATFFDKQIYNSFFSQKNRLIVSLVHVFLGILSPRIWPNDHREVKERIKEVQMMEWHGMALSASSGTINCKMWISMMVPDEVDMEHEAVKCGMCIVKEMNVVKGEKNLLRKKVG